MTPSPVLRLAELRQAGMDRLESLRALQAERPDLELTIPETEHELDDTDESDADDESVPERWTTLGGYEDHDEDPGPYLTPELVELAAVLVQRPAWMADALCKEYADTVTWFPERGESVDPAKDVCARCLVAEECRAFALRNGIKFGIWGGEIAGKRRRSRAA